MTVRVRACVFDMQARARVCMRAVSQGKDALTLKTATKLWDVRCEWSHYM